MKRVNETLRLRRGGSVLRSLGAARASRSELVLGDGDRIAVVGGGPAGSFFAYFLLRAARAVDLDVAVEIYEPRSFDRCGPAGCNHCGGIVSESLVQFLAAEGINLPPEVAQRGIESYVVHMDAGRVEIASPVGERRIAALHRGEGPRTGEALAYHGLDAFLQEKAVDAGAKRVRRLLTGIEWRDGLPHVVEPDGRSTGYDLVCVATGVNSNFLAALERSTSGILRPQTSRTYICEFHSSAEEIHAALGDSMHVFLLDIPRLEFGALIPKGEFVTMCLLGDDLDQELVDAFLDAPEVRRCFPVGSTPCVCSCSPLINLRGAGRPYADRLVLVGDSGVTRLYKDGIGASFRTAKAAATTAVFHGISAEDFRRYYRPTCRSISSDNEVGRLLFFVTHLFKHAPFSRRAILRMTRQEQRRRQGPRPLSSVLWNMFTGSAPYKEIFVGTLRPAFLGGMLWNLVLSLRPANGERTEA